jgi:hypothetical protein
MDPRREIVLALPVPADRILLATKIRSTVLSSSLVALDNLGLRDAYFERLPREHHPTIQGLVVGEWLPMDLGVTHYGAIDGLGISAEQAKANGRLVADRVQKSYLGTMIRTLGLGITPWTILSRTQSFLDRLMLGSAASVTKLGPKDARVELHGVPIALYPYVRSGWAGMFEGTLEVVTRKVYCRDASPPRTESVAVLLLSWA